jgi:NAD(P)-dependent dehydrogenase (short-subunit alcohol dehydrogenase family)
MENSLNIASNPPNNPFSLIGKTILVTGASSGIGRGIAIACSQHGARLLLLGRDTTRLEQTKLLCSPEVDHAVFSMDLQENFLEGNEFSAFLKLNGPIHGFVHASGISPTIPFKVIKKEQVQSVFQLNIFSAIYIIQELTKIGIRAPEGMSLVLISSVMSEVGEKGKSLYAMTKSAIIGMVKSLALEYADKKIRFNAISPSVVNTPLSNKSEYRKDHNLMKYVLDQHPLGLGEVADVSPAAVYLLSDASRWVTGTNLIVDGGFLAR